MKKLKLAIPLTGYILRCSFNDERTLDVDLSDFLDKPFCKAWKEPMFFNHVAIEDGGGAAFWPNGFDICADLLYERGNSKTTQYTP